MPITRKRVMNIAILGATSNIAKDLILNIISKNPEIDVSLFARNLSSINSWLDQKNITSSIKKSCIYEDFKKNDKYDVIFNFVGIGDPAKAIEMGGSIFDITHQYDTLAIDYINHNPKTKYIFLSSGAVYGPDNFSKNVHNQSQGNFRINNFQRQDWYSIAKLHAECRHRSLKDKSIIDIRVFNYINTNLDINSRFLIADAVRAIKYNRDFLTSSNNITRDYIGPDDFYNLIKSFLLVSDFNGPVDCFTKSPVKKFTMLDMLKKEFGLDYFIDDSPVGINSTGDKANYYSKNYIAKDYGYSPIYSSLETIKKEVTQILKNK